MPPAVLLALVAATFVAPAVRAQGHHALLGRGAEVWAVGDSGIVHRSFDHGATFHVSSLGNKPLRGIVARGLRVFVVGDSGKIWRSEDWGGSWNLTVLAGAPALTAVAMPTELVAYAVGANGGVWKTTNGGASWDPQSSGTSARLTAVRFTDAQNGWIVGAGGFAANTTNGGATWNPVATGTAHDLLGVDVRGSRVWLVGERGTARRSTSGGAPFTGLDLKLDAGADVRAVHLGDADTTWIAGGGGFLWRSTDDGATWAYVEHPLHGAVSDLEFVPGALWVSSSRHRALIRSGSAQGLSWAIAGTGASLTRSWTQTLALTATVRGATLCVNPQNPHTIFAMLGKQMYVSRDDGQNWSTYGNAVPGATTTKTNSLVISPKDSNVVVAAVGTPDRIVRSEDGGTSWNDHYTDDFGEYGIPVEMDPDRPDTLYFGVDNDVIMRSLDFGKTWAPWSTTVFRSPCDLVVVPDHDSLVILVGDGITGSGRGRHWRAADATVFVNVDSVAGSEIPGLAGSRLRNSAAFGTAWGTGGVKRTLNYGLTWQTVAPQNNAWGVDICRDDPNVVMFGVYSGGLSYLSTAGGSAGSFSSNTLTGANYSFLLKDRGTMLAEQSNGLWKMNFLYQFPLSSAAPTIAVTAPNGGEIWPAGAVRRITWNASQLALARIEWRESPSGPWQLVADVEGSAGFFDWTVPMQATAQARVRVSDAWDGSPSDMSDANFTIGAAALVASPGALGFGPVGAGGALRLPLSIQNPGTATLTVSAIATATASFQPGRTSLSVPAGSSDTIGVWFLPGGAASYEDTLWLTSDASGTPVTAVPLAGTGVSSSAAGWLATPDPLDFGPALVGLPTRFALRLDNPGSEPLEVSWIGGGSAEVWPGRRTLTLAPYAHDTVGIWYAPQSVGPDTVWLEFTTNEPGHPRLLRVSGYGSAEAGVFEVSRGLALAPAQPNPFSFSTRIRFTLESRMRVRLDVYDVRGERVATLIDGERAPGPHEVVFRAEEAGVRPGVYFYRLSSGVHHVTRKMLLLR